MENGLQDTIVRSSISDIELERIKKFCYDQLGKTQSRGDYNELLQLVLIFLELNSTASVHPVQQATHAGWQRPFIA